MSDQRSFVLDAEALSLLAKADKKMQTWLTYFHANDSAVYASTATIAEVATGAASDAKVRRAVATLRVLEVTAAIGFDAGARRVAAASSRRKPRDLTVDAIVVATAATLSGPVAIVTSDVPDMTLLVGTDPIEVIAV